MYRAMARRTHSWYGNTPQESLHVKSQGERYAVRIGADNLEDESAPGGYRVARRYMTITAACLRTARVVERDHDGRKEWALVGGNGRRPQMVRDQEAECRGGPSVKKKRVKMFEHMDEAED